jgi:outer membrane protein insertion porin family
LGARTGYVKSFSHRDVPLFEREFLGGPDDLRGFPYRGVGPKTQDRFHEPLGGKTFGFGVAEYSVKLSDIFRLVGFADAGFLNPRAINWKMRHYSVDLGVGMRIFLLKMPFRLDFAHPVKSDPGNRHKWRVAYSFGVSF